MVNIVLSFHGTVVVTYGWNLPLSFSRVGERDTNHLRKGSSPSQLCPAIYWFDLSSAFVLLHINKLCHTRLPRVWHETLMSECLSQGDTILSLTFELDGPYHEVTPEMSSSTSWWYKLANKCTSKKGTFSVLALEELAWALVGHCLVRHYSAPPGHKRRRNS